MSGPSGAGGRTVEETVAARRRRLKSGKLRFPALRALCEQSFAFADYETALEAARAAAAARPRNVRARLEVARCLWFSGRIGDALGVAELVERTAGTRAGALGRAGDWYEGVCRFDDAWRCRLKALELEPDNPARLFAVARSAADRGETSKAGRLCDRALFLDPELADAMALRATLRQHDEEDNHVRQLGFVLDRLDPDDPRRAPVAWALGRELEQLGHIDAAFGMLEEGARSLARARARTDAAGPVPDVERDVARLLSAEHVFDGTWLRAAPVPGVENGTPGPVFIVGLPHSGLSLVERLITTLGPFRALGASRLLEQALSRRVGPHGSVEERLSLARSLDLPELAADYDDAVRAVSAGSLRPGDVVLDRSPGNVLLVGLIRNAFPGARVIHVRRHPLDSCLARFRDPRAPQYSGGLEDLGRHTTAFHRLMGHWRRHLEAPFLDVDYGSLVRDPPAELARIATYLGAGAPASVDLDLHDRSLDRHLRFGEALAPLAEILRGDGVPVH